MNFSESQTHEQWLQGAINKLSAHHLTAIVSAKKHKRISLCFTAVSLLGVVFASALHLSWWEPLLVVGLGVAMCLMLEWEIRHNTRCLRDLNRVDPRTDVAPLVNLKEQS